MGPPFGTPKKDLQAHYINNKRNALQTEVSRNFPRIWDFERQKTEQYLRNSIDKGQRTEAEIKAEKQYYKNLTVNSEGVHTVGLIWKDHTRPKDNKRQALKDFRISKARMQQNGGEQWEELSKNVEEWLEKGYCKKLPLDDRTRGFMIPTFVVVRLDKNTTKYRLIINGAYEYAGKCINDYLLKGESLMNHIHDVLIRFRTGKYVLTGDVSQMFLRIKVSEEDQPFLRFFWEDREGKTCIIQATSHLFGLSSSPYVAMKVVRDLALKNMEQLKHGARAIKTDTMVDDLLTTSDKRKGLRKIYDEVNQIFSQGNMQITKFATNDPKLRQMIPEEHWAKRVILDDLEEEMVQQLSGSTPSLKCLGLLYHPESDTIQFLPHPFPSNIEWTKRAVHSFAAKTFDPLGLLAPTLLTPRLIAQALWKRGTTEESLDWDDLVPDTVVKQLQKWSKDFQKIHQKTIPRCVKPANGWTDTRLVVFCDSSTSAQSACGYLLVKTEQGHIPNLWCCKQKLSSINKPESIPRQELIAAVIGTQLAVQICSNIGLDIKKVTFFTDSTTVLWWLRTTRALSVFVTNRLCTIKERTDISQWHHIATDLNSADAPTRSMSASDLINCSLWWEGPPFLKTPMEHWPLNTVLPQIDQDPEIIKQIKLEEKERIHNWTLLSAGFDAQGRDKFIFNIVTSVLPEHKKGQNIFVGLRVLTYAVKFSKILVAAVRKQKYDSEFDVHKDLLNAVLRHAQNRTMQEEYKIIQRDKTLPLNLAQLSAYIAPDGLIRCQSRLTNHTRRDNFGTPAIFTKKDPFSSYFAKGVHDEVLNHTGGLNTMLSTVGEYIYIIGGRKLMIKIHARCAHCQKRKVLSEQLRAMPYLHETRLPTKEKRAFSEIGVDLFGPYRIAAEGASDEEGKPVGVKRWILVLSCNWTRAVNLEVVRHESTKSTCLALDRHTADYGTPDRVSCDGGGNFVGISNDQKQQWYFVMEALKKKQIEWPKASWNFNPAGSPRFGANFESLVKIGRRTLVKMLDHYSLMTGEEFDTLIRRTKCYMNSRPLSQVSSDPNDPRPLTPNDFLTTGKRYRDMVPVVLGEPHLTAEHRGIRTTIQKLWTIYEQEYVRTLHQAQINLKHKPEHYQVGQFVHLIGDQYNCIDIKNRTMPGVLHSICGNYRIGQIVAIHGGVDFKGDLAQRVFTVRVGDRRNPGTLKDERRSYMTIAPFLF